MIRGKRTVHPHACGEHASKRVVGGALTGSSPRVWGTQPGNSCPGVRRRFIPTRVGNTEIRQCRGVPRSVHPHACGEHRWGRPTRLFDHGSSPRVWGTPNRCVFCTDILRFIPTRVGNTESMRFLHRYSPVHPHACGEHKKLRPTRVGGLGSSPRVWGTLSIRISYFNHIRFIPTRVGNTLQKTIIACFCSVHPHACGEHLSFVTPRKNCYGSSPRVWGTRATGLFDF